MNSKKLNELIINNPGTPVKFFVDTDSFFDDTLPYSEARIIGEPRVETIYSYADEYFEKEDLEELIMEQLDEDEDLPDIEQFKVGEFVCVKLGR